MYTLFAKTFPMVAVTDVREHESQRKLVPLGRTRLPSLAGKE